MVKKATVVLRKCKNVVELWGIFSNEEKALESVKTDPSLQMKDGTILQVELVEDPEHAEGIYLEQDGWKLLLLPIIGEEWGYMITDTIQ